jgi:hypothetical protein
MASIQIGGAQLRRSRVDVVDQALVAVHFRSTSLWLEDPAHPSVPQQRHVIDGIRTSDHPSDQ